MEFCGIYDFEGILREFYWSFIQSLFLFLSLYRLRTFRTLVTRLLGVLQLLCCPDLGCYPYFLQKLQVRLTPCNRMIGDNHLRSSSLLVLVQYSLVLQLEQFTHTMNAV